MACVLIYAPPWLEAEGTGVKELGSLDAFSLISSMLPLISLIVLYNACDPSSAMSVTVGHHFVLEWNLRFPPKNNTDAVIYDGE